MVVVESHLERTFVTRLRQLAPELEPLIVREVVFAPPRKWRFDFAIPACMVAIEIDGGQYVARGGRHNTDSDREKLNYAAVLGWRVLRFSGSQLENDPVQCMALIRLAMEWER